jgi:hypothetical protein
VSIIASYNQALRIAAARCGHAVVDIYGSIAGPDGFALPGYHLDTIHLKPSTLSLVLS